MKSQKQGAVILLLGMCSLTAAQAQKGSSYEEMLQMATENNGLLKSSSLQVEQSKALINSSYNFDKTRVYYSFDENNQIPEGGALNVWGVSQDFNFPTVYGAQRKLNKANYNLSAKELVVRQQQLEKELAIAYQNFLLAHEMRDVYGYLDSLFTIFDAAANRKYELGGSDYLEKLTAQSKKRQLSVELKQAQEDISVALQKLKGIVQTDSLQPQRSTLKKLDIQLKQLEESPVKDYFDSKVMVMNAEAKYQKQQWLPDINLEYFQGSNQLIDRNYIGYTFGLKIPLFFNAQASRVKASKIAVQLVQEQARNYQEQLKSRFLTLKAEMDKYKAALDYYEAEGKQLSEELIKTATVRYKTGDLDYFQFIQSLENGSLIQLDYLSNLNQYNQTVIKINHLTLN